MTETAEKFDRVYALMKFERGDLISWIEDYLGLSDVDGTYAFWLTRNKSSRNVGTMELSDFEEFDGSDVASLVDFLLEKLKTNDES
jgi:hypothetical protein